MVEVTLRLSLMHVHPEVLPKCVVGGTINAWTKPQLDFVDFYTPKLGGLNRVGRMPKAQVPVFSLHWSTATATVAAIEGTTVILSVVFTITEEVAKAFGL